MEIMKYGSIETIQSSIAKHLSPISVAFKAAYLLLTSYNSFFSRTKVIYNKEKAAAKEKKLQYFCKKQKFFLKKFGGIKKTLYFCTRNQTKD